MVLKNYAHRYTAPNGADVRSC